MAGLGWRRLVVAELAPVDDLEAALLAVVRGEIRGATLQRVAELLGGRPLTQPGGHLPGALLARRLCALDAVEGVDRAAMLALWALAQPLAQVVEARVAPRVGGEVVWADAVLRVARDDGRPLIVGAASVGWALTDDRIAAWLGAPLEELPELLLFAADRLGATARLLWCCHGPGLEEPGDPLAQTLAELFADVKRRLLESVTVQALRERFGRGPAGHDDPKPS
ncbi:MAG TPA: hypothetical protein VFA46_14975 [Actinomycetes bacterium]|jgi:hypothetical protein|nr:hypothetical protein [Actinomycetes bacterium]